MDSALFKIVLLAVGLVILVAALKALEQWLGRRGQGQAMTAPYRLRDDFMSRAESEFYYLLVRFTQDWAALFVKVNLGDVLYAPRQAGRQQRAMWNRISQKHLDYLLCDRMTLRPLVAIELDDRSHERADRIARDQFVDAALAQAGLPIVHVPLQSSYDTAQLAATLRNAALREPAPAAPAMTPTVASPQPAPQVAPGKAALTQIESTAPTLGTPRCPQCGGAMVLRVARKGKNAGQEFWGCENYPQCRGIREV